MVNGCFIAQCRYLYFVPELVLSLYDAGRLSCGCWIRQLLPRGGQGLWPTWISSALSNEGAQRSKQGSFAGNYLPEHAFQVHVCSTEHAVSWTWPRRVSAGEWRRCVERALLQCGHRWLCPGLLLCLPWVVGLSVCPQWNGESGACRVHVRPPEAVTRRVV